MFFQLDLVVGAGMAVLVVGGVKAVATDLSDEKTSAALRKVGAIILVVVVVLLGANMVLFFWMLYPRLDNHGRQVRRCRSIYACNRASDVAFIQILTP